MSAVIKPKRVRVPFWDKVAKAGPDDCWPWIGYVKEASGHGFTSYKSSPMHASRKAWILTHGWPGTKLSVLHRCDNALCCNPAHMYLGTRADNMIDRWAETPAAERGQRNRCRVLTDAQVAEFFEQIETRTLQEWADYYGVHISTMSRYKAQRFVSSPFGTE